MPSIKSILVLAVPAAALVGTLVALTAGLDGSDPVPTATAAAAAAPRDSRSAPATRAPAVQRAADEVPSTTEQPSAAAKPKQTTTPAEREAELVTKLRAGAPAAGAWTSNAQGVVGAWRATGVKVGALECHQHGCFAVATYADELARELAEDTLTKSDAFLAYPGWRHRSYKQLPSGEIAATWFFMNPDDAR